MPYRAQARHEADAHCRFHLFDELHRCKLLQHHDLAVVLTCRMSTNVQRVAITAARLQGLEADLGLTGNSVPHLNIVHT